MSYEEQEYMSIQDKLIMFGLFLVLIPVAIVFICIGVIRELWDMLNKRVISLRL